MKNEHFAELENVCFNSSKPEIVLHLKVKVSELNPIKKTKRLKSTSLFKVDGFRELIGNSIIVRCDKNKSIDCIEMESIDRALCDRVIKAPSKHYLYDGEKFREDKLKLYEGYTESLISLFEKYTFNTVSRCLTEAAKHAKDNDGQYKDVFKKHGIIHGNYRNLVKSFRDSCIIKDKESDLFHAQETFISLKKNNNSTIEKSTTTKPESKNTDRYSSGNNPFNETYTDNSRLISYNIKGNKYKHYTFRNDGSTLLERDKFPQIFELARKYELKGQDKDPLHISGCVAEDVSNSFNYQEGVDCNPCLTKLPKGCGDIVDSVNNSKNVDVKYIGCESLKGKWKESSVFLDVEQLSEESIDIFEFVLGRLSGKDLGEFLIKRPSNEGLSLKYAGFLRRKELLEAYNNDNKRFKVVKSRDGKDRIQIPQKFLIQK